MLTKFATQLDTATLNALRELARSQGRQVQALVGEAVKNYLDRHNQGHIRQTVLQALEQSTGDFGSVYANLVGKS